MTSPSKKQELSLSKGSPRNQKQLSLSKRSPSIQKQQMLSKRSPSVQKQQTLAKGSPSIKKQQTLEKGSPSINKQLAVRRTSPRNPIQERSLIGQKRPRDDNDDGKTLATADEKPVELSFKSRMSPSGLMAFIKSNPSEAQLRDIEFLGFGGLMKLCTDEVPGKLACWLVSNFDYMKCSLMNDELQLLDEDVHLCTGLPMGPIEVKEATTGCRDELFLTEKKKWFNQFGNPRNVSRGALLDKMISQRDGGDEFMRNFIVYVMSTFLMGVKGDAMTTRILNSLVDLSKVSSFNWCAFTLRHLSLTVSEWQKDPNKNYKGPIMVLIFIYLDRVVFRWRSVKRVFPILAAWSKNDINSRLSIEEKKGFGKGSVHDRMTLDPPKHSENVGVKEDATVDLSSDCVIAKLKKAAVDFAQSYGNFSTALKEAQLINPNSEFVVVMSSLLRGITDGYSTVVDEDVVEDHEEETKEDQVEQPVEFTDEEQKPIKDIFAGLGSDEEILAIVLEFEKSFGCGEAGVPKMKKRRRDKRPMFPSPNFHMSDYESTQEGELPHSDATADVQGCAELNVASGSGKGVEVSHSIPDLQGCVEELNLDSVSVEAVEHSDAIPGLSVCGDEFHVATGSGKDVEQVSADCTIPSDSNPSDSKVIKESYRTGIPRVNTPYKNDGWRIDSQDGEALSFKLISSEEFLPQTTEDDNPLPDTNNLDLLTDVAVASPTVAVTTSCNLEPDTKVDVPVELREFVDVAVTVSAEEEKCALDDSVAVPITPLCNALQTGETSPTSGTTKDASILITPSVNLDELFAEGSTIDAPILVSPTIDCTPPSTANIVLEVVSPPSRRNTHPSCWYRSPFLVRHADVFGNLTHEEKDLSDYAFADLDDCEVLYSTANYTLKRYQFKFLAIGSKVDDDALGVWCEVLNHMEKFKASSSPLRLFFADKSHILPHPFDYKLLSLVFIPVIDPAALLFVVNLRLSTIEIVSAKRPQAYEQVLNDVVDLVAFHLSAKIPKAKDISKFKIQPYTPKSNIGQRVDRGLYLMRYMETYMGRRTGYKSSITTDSCLRRLSVKYCHLILTFDENKCKETILQASRTFKKTIIDEDVGKEIPYTDNYLKDVVFGEVKPLNEILVKNDWVDVTRKGLRTLAPTEWIMDSVIDAFGIQVTLGQNEILFFSTIMQFYAESKKQFIQVPKYMPNTAEKVEKIFFPILSKTSANHWYACVVDMVKSECYVLDSLENRRSTARLNLAKKIVFNTVDMFSKHPGFERLLSIKEFKFVTKPVVQQDNGWDCGVFVMRWLISVYDEDLWNDEDYLANHDDFRDNVFFGLLRWNENKRKVF